jgi:hypothetical protein
MDGKLRMKNGKIKNEELRMENENNAILGNGLNRLNLFI